MRVITRRIWRSRPSWAVHRTACAAGVDKQTRDADERPCLSSDEKARIKELERENRELRQANEILKKASAYFAQAELDRPFRK